jgi:hypothetical protein
MRQRIIILGHEKNENCSQEWKKGMIKPFEIDFRRIRERRKTPFDSIIG